VPTRSLAAGLALALPLLAAAAPPELAADIPANTSTRAQARVGVNYTPGVLERSGDRDWFRVKLTEGQGYIIKAERNSAPPDPPWDLETVLRDPRGKVLARIKARTDNPLDLPIIPFVAPRTGTYFVEVGGTATGPTRARLGYGVLVAPDCAASPRTTCLLRPGAAPNHAIQTVNDVDWLRTALTVGRSYTIELTGGRTTFTLALIDARGRRVATGEVPAEGSAIIRHFVPSATGDYDAVVTATEPGLIFAGYNVAIRSP
jgi:hypothetical protein